MIEPRARKRRPSSYSRRYIGVLLAADRLARAKARPRFVEHVLRLALRDAIAWRIGGGAAPRNEALSAAAIVATRRLLDGLAPEPAELSRTLNAVQCAKRALTGSKLWRRLMCIPASRFIGFEPTADGPDAVVRDCRGHIHAIALRFTPDAFAAGRAALTVAESTALPLADRLTPISIHIFCLKTRRRYTFELDIARNAGHAHPGLTAA